MWFTKKQEDALLYLINSIKWESTSYYTFFESIHTLFI